MIDVLLATYNGDKYIEAQIYSLLTQTYKDWKLIIHDDGSTDKTLEIIKQFQERDSRITLIEDGIKCGGAGTNFLHILKHYSTADYIIFCDQDDIWWENKLAVMLSYFNDNDIPQGVFAGGYLYSNKKGIMGDIPSPILSNFEEAFFIAGGLQGCSFMFNKKVANIANQYNGYMVMHDFLITLIVLTFGKLTYIDNKLMLYRQEHEGKTTRNVEKNRIAVLKNRFPVIDDMHYKSLLGFVENFYNQLTPDQKYNYAQFQKIYNSKNIWHRLYIVLRNRFTLDKSILKLMIKIILRPFI